MTTHYSIPKYHLFKRNLYFFFNLKNYVWEWKLYEYFESLINILNKIRWKKGTWRRYQVMIFSYYLVHHCRSCQLKQRNKRTQYDNSFQVVPTRGPHLIGPRWSHCSAVLLPRTWFLPFTRAWSSDIVLLDTWQMVQVLIL